MENYLVTYNVHQYETREDVVEQIENALTKLGLQKQDSNQTTFYGNSKTNSFISDLHSELLTVKWKKEDIVTVYHPSISTDNNGKKIPNIEKKEIKSKDKNLLNLII